MEVKKMFTVNVKGHFAAMKSDILLKKPFMDIRFGYGKITFWSTEEEEEDFLDYLVVNEGKFGFKII